MLVLGLDPPREQLAERINARCRRMFESGLVEEVRGVLSLGFPATSKALESIGYREALMYLGGDISYEAAVRLTQAATRQYAKRQRTWFRREPNVCWFHSFGDQRETLESAKAATAATLNLR
jgi:tRNA dimethylallyltransferase